MRKYNARILNVDKGTFTPLILRVRIFLISIAESLSPISLKTPIETGYSVLYAASWYVPWDQIETLYISDTFFSPLLRKDQCYYQCYQCC